MIITCQSDTASTSLCEVPTSTAPVFYYESTLFYYADVLLLVIACFIVVDFIRRLWSRELR